jgi:hypothetical protein
VLLVAQLVEVDHLIALSAHHDDFRGIAGHRPGLDERVQLLVGIDDDGDDA